MKEIKIINNNYQANDGKIFTTKEECLIYEINQDIKKGKQITINDFIEQDIIKSFMCRADSYIDFIHGTNKGAIEKDFTRLKLVRKDINKDDIFYKKNIVYIDYHLHDVTIYVHMDKKDWNKELSAFVDLKNPHVVAINEIDFNTFN